MVTAAASQSAEASIEAPAGTPAGTLRGVPVYVTENEGIKTATWIEKGTAYALDIECTSVRDQRCASPEEIAAFCRVHHIRWLALFGSVLRDDFRDDSDVDVLVEFIPEYPITFFDLHEMEEILSRLFAGRRIDLVTVGSLHRLIRGRVLPLAEVQYAER